MPEASENQKDKQLTENTEPETSKDSDPESTLSSAESETNEAIADKDAPEVSNDSSSTDEVEPEATSSSDTEAVKSSPDSDERVADDASQPGEPQSNVAEEASQTDPERATESVESNLETNTLDGETTKEAVATDSSEKVEEVNPLAEKPDEDQKNEASVTASTIREPTTESESDEPEAQDEETETPDYSELGREELAREMERLARGDEINNIADQVRELKSHFDSLEETRRQQAQDEFVKGGGELEGFEYRPDEFYTLFYAAYDKIRERRSEYRSNRESTRQENLKAKEEILNKLRDFVDSEETQVSISKLKELQQEWRNIGEVPSSQNRTLWANYHALLDRFYDNRSIYFELKELDRKKNLEGKIAIAERAEQLVEEPDIKKAAKELDELHEEYKHLGPVPRDEQEALWQRFKAASDKIHERRREDIEAFKEQLKKNLEEKLKLVEEVKAFTGFESDSIKEWNKKTKEIQQVQKRWEAAGSMPKSQAKEVNRQFWSSFKAFFAHKGEFFQRLDAQREENLQKKEALVEKAESLKDSENWKETSNELKRLQREWKDIGPVPEKSRESVYQKFKAACDAFFERRRNNSQEAEVEYQKNLKIREAVCDKIEALAEKKSSDLDALTELIQQYRETGFVPRSSMKSISDRYNQAVQKFVENAEELDENQKKEILVEIELGAMRGGPGGQRKINLKEGNIRRQISRLESDISLWKNNISFFTSSSKQADKLIADVEQKIEKATAEVEQLKSQLNVLQSLKRSER